MLGFAARRMQSDRVSRGQHAKKKGAEAPFCVSVNLSSAAGCQRQIKDASITATLCLDLTPLDHVAVVLGQGFGKGMATRAISDEEQVIRFIRIDRGL